MLHADLTKPRTETKARQIILRTRGNSHGPITRLVSPGDLGQFLKPFVFVDLFDTTKISFGGFGLHPHSGIATVTYLFEGAAHYEDTTGATGTLPARGVEWFKAAHGAWHGGGNGEPVPSRGFQLWISLPPDHELGEVESIYQAPASIAQVGPARMLVGSHQGASSPLNPGASMNYLAVHLQAGETWRYLPPADHTVGWIALASGALEVSGDTVEHGEVVVFDKSNAAIEVRARKETEFVLGSAAPATHDLVLGRYSVHTSQATLRAGEDRILEIRRQLIADGRF